MAAKDPFIESVKEKAKSVMGDSNLFKVVRHSMTKEPSRPAGSTCIH